MPSRDYYDDYPPSRSRRSEREPPRRVPRRPPRQSREYDADWEVEEQKDVPPPPMERDIAPRRGKDVLRPEIGAVIIFFGIIIFFGGAMMVHSAQLMEEPEEGDYTSDEKFDKAWEKYEDDTRQLVGAGSLTCIAGTMITTIPLFIMGVSSKNLDRAIKATMIAVAGGIIMVTLVVIMKFSWSPF